MDEIRWVKRNRKRGGNSYGIRFSNPANGAVKLKKPGLTDQQALAVAYKVVPRLECVSGNWLNAGKSRGDRYLRGSPGDCRFSDSENCGARDLSRRKRAGAFV
uniref:Uncharacterized protein n=1 Tax=Candidatus Methanogaster sp. ANME-2c ERB4 TaxID=2759911 RepID=A0A7G9Y6G6_9EURY|nr:hypothetical protein HMEJMANM_00044 [Methanosarcinales archaeon ANME-2c ERB4]QNO43600.1 hypothetical protein LAPIAFBC_00007 [Methanosarcinales archaeon ANME-2c ERB4]QNO44719.1 hypothetical protein DFBDAOMO_00003 [Methanosarcinales archaeon ANME-2c ERB4]QNO50340.1 hypothetical protein PMDBIBLC_00002 [Methanosarcinales archaeon ANME-2c ERB4]